MDALNQKATKERVFRTSIVMSLAVAVGLLLCFSFATSAYADTRESTTVSATLIPTGTLTITPDESGSDIKSVLALYSNDIRVNKVVLQGSIVAPADMSQAFDSYFYLTEIIGLQNLDTSQVTNMSYLFSSCTSLTSLDLSSFNTSQVTDMSGMFFLSRGLVSLDLSNFDTSQVTNMNSMFFHCYSLTSLNLSNFNTSRVTDMNDMFATCKSLPSLNVSSFNTSQVTDMGNMFSSCSSLTSLNLSNFTTSQVTKMRDMFRSCTSLTSLDLSNFYTSAASDVLSMFSDCMNLTYIKVGLLHESAASQIVPKINTQGVFTWTRDGGEVAQIAPYEKATYIALADEGFDYVGLSASAASTLPSYPIVIMVKDGNLIDSESIVLSEGDTFEGLYRSANASEEARWNLEVDEVTTPVELFVNAGPNFATVTFETNGGTLVPPTVVAKGQVPKQPVDPVRDNHIFAGWYSDQALTIAYTFTLPATVDMTLYAKWKKISATETRLAGNDAFGTMQVIINNGSFATGQDSSVIITDVSGYWDALSASGLGGLAEAPILLSNTDSLPLETAAIIAAINPSDIYIVGGTSVISSEVEQRLVSLFGIVPTRIAGPTATDTAVEVYNQGKTVNMQWSNTAFIASNAGYWDALAIAPYAWASGSPIFLSEGSTHLSDKTIEALQKGKFTEVYITGGASVVSDAVVAQLAQAGIAYAGRLAGDTAADTSVAVANFSIHPARGVSQMQPNNVAVADLNGYWDALTGAALCGQNNAPILLVSDDATSAIDRFVSANKDSIFEYKIFGGEAAVSSYIGERLQDLVK